MQPLLDWCVNISRKAQEKKTSKTQVNDVEKNYCIEKTLRFKLSVIVI